MRVAGGRGGTWEDGVPGRAGRRVRGHRGQCLASRPAAAAAVVAEHVREGHPAVCVPRIK